MNEKSLRELTLERYVEASKLSWQSYKDWIVGDIQARQFQMKIHLKDWMVGEALLHGERRRRINQ